MDIIKSKDNNKIKYVRNLYMKKFRDEENAFVVEGIKFVNEAINERADIKFLLVSEEILNKNGVKELLNSVEKNIVVVCTEQVFCSAADTVNAQGILAVINKNIRNKEKVFNEYRFLIMCDRIQDPGNLGTIVRIADAFGPAAVVLNKGCADIYNPKVVRASAGAIFRVPVTYIEDTEISTFKENGFFVVSTVVDSLYSFDEVQMNDKICVVIGNEGQGVSQEIINNSSMSITIKMSGRAESLNASVAAGISIYEMRKKLL